MKKISIIHATRRGSKSWGAINMWLLNASHKTPIEYILSVDTDDSQDYDFSSVLDFPEFKVIRNSNRSAVDAFNNGAKVATGDLFICISDDMACFLDWDVDLLNEVSDLTDFYLKVQDGLQPTLVTLPIFDRVYYNRLGYVWNDQFRHMFCDQEATAIAIMLGRYVKSNLLFTHAHYTTGQTQCDELNLRNNSTWVQGETLFNERLKTNFGLSPEQIVKPYESIVWR